MLSADNPKPKTVLNIGTELVGNVHENSSQVIPLIIVFHHKRAPMQSIAFTHIVCPLDPPPPPCISGPTSVDFKGFWEFAWANMGETCQKKIIKPLV